jgi:hypothetical protein
MYCNAIKNSATLYYKGICIREDYGVGWKNYHVAAEHSYITDLCV